MTAVADEEDFVTAVLAEFHEDHDDAGELRPPPAGAGHRPAGVALVSTGEPVPPLGLGPVPRPVTSQWPGGSRMLIYTDGLVEARDRRGAFFPWPTTRPPSASGARTTRSTGSSHASATMPDAGSTTTWPSSSWSTSRRDAPAPR